jgi:hypothetical protein
VTFEQKKSWKISEAGTKDSRSFGNLCYIESNFFTTGRNILAEEKLKILTDELRKNVQQQSNQRVAKFFTQCLNALAAWSSGMVSACHRGDWSYGS